MVYVSESKCGAVCGWWFFFFFQAEDGIRDAQESRGLGDVYKRQVLFYLSLLLGLLLIFSLQNYGANFLHEPLVCDIVVLGESVILRNIQDD